MKISVLIAVAAALNAGCSSEVSGLGDGVGQTAARMMTGKMECLGAEYAGHAFASPTAIPDDDPIGVTIGPLDVPRTIRTLEDVVLGMDIRHADTADLSFSLHYDTNGDGRYEASTPIEVYLARPGGCSSEELWSCPVELGGVYFFRDEGWQAAGEEASLEAFDGLPGGGSFYLSIKDTDTGNSGILVSWVIYARSERGRGLNHLVGLVR